MQLVILIGIQATGKTTFYKEQFFGTHVRISLDVLKTRRREALFFDTCLQSRQKLVIDNTNPKLEDRQRYIPKARQAGFEVVGYYFESRIERALERNAQRSGKQRIPAVGIRSTYNKLQPPSLAEGFDKLYYVSIEADGSFSVEEWRDEKGANGESFG